MDICGRRLVLPLDVAEKIMELAFDKGEVYEEKWNAGKDGKPSFYTTHVYEIDPSKFQYNAELMSEAQYQMYRLAGKPE
jgi:hypothetical protein